MGAAEAAKYGAVASVVRSMGTRTDDFPHTGVMKYNDSVPSIPAFAISTAGAAILSAKLSEMPASKLFLLSHCKVWPDKPSFNVIGEIKGTMFPDEIITLGGHLDSWDVGEGAHDDGAGVVQAFETLHLLNKMGLRPKRTIRAVAFMNEENGGKGGDAYAENVQTSEKHIAALESDMGAGCPVGFGISGLNEAGKAKVEAWKKEFMENGISQWRNSGGGADIEALHKKTAVPTIAFLPDPSRYFFYHHTANDVFENIDKKCLEQGAAAIAALVWLISENGLN